MNDIRGTMADVRYAGRLLLRSPMYTAAVVVTFALALGANAAVFSLVRAIVFEPVQVPEPDRLVRVVARYTAPASGGAGQTAAGAAEPREIGAFIYPTYVQLAETARSFTGLAASFTRLARVIVDERAAAAAREDPGDDDAIVALVTPNFFDVTGVGVQRGRGFLIADDLAGAPPVAVLSDRAWRRWFNADPAILDRIVRVQHVPLTIVGVLQPGFRGLNVGFEVDVFVPGVLAGRVTSAPGNYRSAGVVDGYSPSAAWEVIGRLQPHATVATAEAELTTLLAAEWSAPGRPAREVPRVHVSLRTIADAAIGAHARTPVITLLVLLSGVALLVLAIGCSNVSALLLARGDERRRELGIRAALGASRTRLASLAIAEVALLIVAGVALAIVVRQVMLRTLTAFSLPGEIRIEALELRGDGLVIAATGLLAVVVVVIVSMLPAWRASRVDIVRTLARQPRATHASAMRGSVRSQSLLLALQVTLSVILVIGAALFVRSIREALARDMGFDVERLLIAELPADRHARGDAAAVHVGVALERARERLLQLPGVRGVSYGDMPYDFTMAGPSVFVGSREIRTGTAPTRFVGPRYVETLGLRLIAGRTIDERETAANSGAAHVALVSESFARRVFGDSRSTLGQRFWPGKPFDEGDEIEVIGVVGDTAPLGLTERRTPAFLLPRAQHQTLARAFATQMAVRVSAEDAVALAPVVSSLLHEIEPAQPQPRVTTARILMARQTMTQQLAASVLGWFSGLALLLTCGGVYALTAYVQTRRTHEIGVRVALGATGRQIAGLVLRTGALPVAIGAVAGLVSARMLGRFVQSLLFGIAAADAMTWSISVLLVLIGAGCACVIPVRRALRVQPAIALRAE